MENLVIIGTEITANTSDIPVNPNALKVTHASVDKDRQAISLAIAVTANIAITLKNMGFNVGVLDVVLTEKLISAFAADLERGTYPMFLANETTFSLNVAESKKDSFTTMLELNAVM